jgi:putative photosynthetic complex assembly protein 2
VSVLLPALIFATLLWFFSTGAILWLNRLPRDYHPGAITAATPLAAAAVCATIVSGGETGAAAHYLAFSSAIVLWGWHEMSFLMGFVNGPRRTPCPAGVRGWRRFVVSAETVIHHEVALAATLAGIAALTWGQPNQTATLTFAILFAMRLSAKLNIFLGVANLSAEMMPDHLAYLKTYFRSTPMNALFPLSIAGCAAVAFWLTPVATESTGSALLLALVLLGLIEHLLMMLPVRDAALWRWAEPPILTNPEKWGGPDGL